MRTPRPAARAPILMWDGKRWAKTDAEIVAWVWGNGEPRAIVLLASGDFTHMGQHQISIESKRKRRERP